MRRRPWSAAVVLWGAATVMAWLCLATSPTPALAAHNCTATGTATATCNVPTSNAFTCDAFEYITVTVTSSGGSVVSGHARCPAAGLGGKGAVVAFVNKPSGTSASSASSPLGLDSTGNIDNNTLGECGGSQGNGNIDQTITVSCSVVAIGGGGAPALSEWGLIGLGTALPVLGVAAIRRRSRRA